MGKSFCSIVVGVALVAAAARSSHAEPAWCNQLRTAENGAANQLDTQPTPIQTSRLDVENLALTRLHGAMGILCHPNNIDGNRAQDAERFRGEFLRRFHLSDGDWPDVLALLADPKTTTDLADDYAYSTQELGKLTPIDQFKLVHHAVSTAGGIQTMVPNTIYLADMLDAHLSMLGRLALLEFCLTPTVTERPLDNVPTWAACQRDIDAYDPARAVDELRADSTISPAYRTALRMRAYELAEAIQAYAARRQAAERADPAFKQMYDVAAKGRDRWTQEVGGQKDLLDLVLAMDSSAIFHSRKLKDGCEAPTDAALEAAIATIPAAEFKGKHDGTKDKSYKKFSEAIKPILLHHTQVQLAMRAYVTCHPKSPRGLYFLEILKHALEERGPREAALLAIAEHKWTFDDTRMGAGAGGPPAPPPPPGMGGGRGSRAPSVPLPDYLVMNKPDPGEGGTSLESRGGVVGKVIEKPNEIIVKMEKTSVTRPACVQDHMTNRISRIDPGGHFEYEYACDKWGMETVDTTAEDVKLHKRWATWVKPGEVVSRIEAAGNATEVAGDLIGVWPTKTADLPTMVLGAAVK